MKQLLIAAMSLKTGLKTSQRAAPCPNVGIVDDMSLSVLNPSQTKQTSPVQPLPSSAPKLIPVQGGNKVHFAIPSHVERMALSTSKTRRIRFDNLRAAHVIAYTGLEHNQLWFYVLVADPTNETREKLAPIFKVFRGNTYVYQTTNDHALEVWR